MIPNELVEQLRAEVKLLKEGQDKFLQTYKRLCAHLSGPEWRNEKDIESVFYHVRKEIIPIMEQAGMDSKQVQALCSWAAKLTMEQ
jgi:hypothetical protein